MLKSPLAILLVIATAAAALAAVVVLGDEPEAKPPTLLDLKVAPDGGAELLPVFRPNEKSYVARCPGPRLEVSLKMPGGVSARVAGKTIEGADTVSVRSEERRVGKECRSRWSPHH